MNQKELTQIKEHDPIILEYGEGCGEVNVESYIKPNYHREKESYMYCNQFRLCPICKAKLQEAKRIYAKELEKRIRLGKMFLILEFKIIDGMEDGQIAIIKEIETINIIIKYIEGVLG